MQWLLLLGATVVKARKKLADLRKLLLNFLKGESITLQLFNLLATVRHVGGVKLIA
jgi:hypothetical protein